MTPMEQYIREYAASIGLNPDIVMRVVLSEGGRSSLEPGGYTRQSLIQGRGGQEQSYGPFQMYMGRGALGDRALRAGFDPRDPAQAFNVARFAMDTMAREGLGAWHGWKGSPWAAHGGKASGKVVATPDTHYRSKSDPNFDPRLDTPSSGRPTGSELPGPPEGGQYDLKARHPQNPQVGTGGYVQPGAPGYVPPAAICQAKDQATGVW